MYIQKDGKNIEVKLDSQGKPYFIDKNGNIQMVNFEDQPKVLIDENGQQYVIGKDGQKLMVLVNEFG